MVPTPQSERPERPAGKGLGLAEAHAIYRQMALYDMAFEVQFGLEMAFLRTFAIPVIAEVLVGTGEIEARPLKRSLDTALMMYEIIDAGPDVPRARAVIRRLNQMHRALPIGEDEYSYVLTTFIVPALRWMDTYGWRPSTQIEKEAVTTFYRRVGELMGLAWVPASYGQAARFLDNYEADHLRPSPEAQRLMAVTGDVLATRMPSWACSGVPHLGAAHAR